MPLDLNPGEDDIVFVMMTVALLASILAVIISVAYGISLIPGPK